MVINTKIAEADEEKIKRNVLGRVDSPVARRNGSNASDSRSRLWIRRQLFLYHVCQDTGVRGEIRRTDMPTGLAASSYATLPDQAFVLLKRSLADIPHQALSAKHGQSRGTKPYDK